MWELPLSRRNCPHSHIQLCGVTVTKEILQFKDTFSQTYSLYTVALTIGVSTATWCEYSFSTVTRILQPRRRSMTHERKAHAAGAFGR